MENETIGNFIRRLRQKKQLSQRKLAELSGIDREYICQLEGGRTQSITLRTARALAKGLGVRPEIFLSSRDTEGLYLSEHIFEGVFKEIQERYDFPSQNRDDTNH